MLGQGARLVVAATPGAAVRIDGTWETRGMERGDARDGTWRCAGSAPRRIERAKDEFVNFTSLATFLLIIANIYFGKALFRQRRDYGKD